VFGVTILRKDEKKKVKEIQYRELKQLQRNSKQKKSRAR
jgi:hypothetical protein